ncbi:hypothetical protein R1sor_021628 [Riccia sorocarpa]|uniref:RWD domain-containing protein n=1 Tax=Riccia sorocarpa TaxID=122646 RepID=A0ABD3GJH9_9MARC
MEDSDVPNSCRARQLAEVEAIRAMYPEEGEFQMTDSEVTTFEILSQLDEDASCPPYLSISFTLHLLSTSVGGRHLSASFTFPRLYPEKEPVRVSVECGGLISKHEHERFSLSAHEAARETLGEEAVLHVMQKLQELAWEFEESTKSATAITLNPNSESAPGVLERKAIWFHHIKSTQKRKDILEWGAELELGGFCKPGFPGVLIVEGEGRNVAEYVKRIQRLRWQAMQIRGEEIENLAGGQELSVLRRFPVGIKELSESAVKMDQAPIEETLGILFSCRKVPFIQSSYAQDDSMLLGDEGNPVFSSGYPLSLETPFHVVGVSFTNSSLFIPYNKCRFV